MELERRILLTLAQRYRMLRTMSRTHKLPDHFAFAIESQVEESLAVYKMVKKLVKESQKCG